MRLLTYDDLRDRGVKYSRNHIRRREKVGTFPLHVDLGEGRIAWIEAEIIGWIADLAAKRAPVAADVSLPSEQIAGRADRQTAP
jgi:predicted DNA-binding transcriptional regulator AlpA